MYKCVWYFCIYLYGLSLRGWHAWFRITNNRHITKTMYAIKRHFLIWMTMMRQPMKRWYSCVLTLNYTFICVYWWTRQRIHNTLIVVDRYLRLMGDKMIPDSAEPRLESFYAPFVAGIDLPHQGVVDSYNLDQGWLVYWRIYMSLALNELSHLCCQTMSLRQQKIADDYLKHTFFSKTSEFWWNYIYHELREMNPRSMSLTLKKLGPFCSLYMKNRFADPVQYSESLVNIVDCDGLVL